MELLGDQIAPIEVWRTFLHADFCSKREGTASRITGVLKGKDPALKDHLELGPDGWDAATPISEELADLVREALLACHGATLAGLPADINGATDTMVWHRARIDADDDLRLLAYSEFMESTGHTLLPERAEQLFRTTRMLDDIVDGLDRDDRLPPMICVATEPGATLFVLDGNQRAVAHRIRQKWPVEVIVGFSQSVEHWAFFPKYALPEQ